MSQVRKIVGQLNGLAERVMVSVVEDLTEGLREDTPKDTEWASVNWMPTVGTPFPESRTGDPDVSMVPSQRILQQYALASVKANYRFEMGPLFVTNTVPYIDNLNGGSSIQAPAAFVQARIARSLNAINRRRFV